MASYIESTMKSMEELDKSANTCDFNAVRLSATTMRLLDGALETGEITHENYYTMVDRIGIIADKISKNCTCAKMPKR